MKLSVKKTLIFLTITWSIIAIAIIPVSNGQESDYQSLSYSQFVRSVQENEIEQVVFGYNRSYIWAFDREGHPAYVAIPFHPDLVNLLLEKNIEITVSNIDENRKNKIFDAIFPNIIMIILVVFLIIYLLVWSYKVQKKVLELAERQTKAIEENNQLLKTIIENQSKI